MSPLQLLPVKCVCLVLERVSGKEGSGSCHILTRRLLMDWEGTMCNDAFEEPGCYPAQRAFQRPGSFPAQGGI